MNIKQAAAVAGILLGMVAAPMSADAAAQRGTTAAHVKPGAKPHKRHKTAKRSSKAGRKDQAAKDTLPKEAKK